ncbi:MAG TPA: carboxypeptidase regulatory-like domain-containing protein [Thermoanaerobaculia bacterium]|nr:carboxypeptidase regulatory-like domain-containing protein [Thermoanaerobaculia bacterium]
MLLVLALPARSQSLRVVDPEGRPVAGARVVLLAAPGEGAGPLSRMRPPLAEGQTDASGAPPFPLPLRDGLQLAVDSPDFTPWAHNFSQSRGEFLLTLRRGRTWTRKLDLGKEPATTPGRACASWSETVPGWEMPVTWKRCADVSTAGEFTLKGLGSDRVDLDVEIPGFLSLKRSLVVGSATPLRLRRGTPLTGRIVGPGPSGPPVVKATVAATGSATVESGDGGAFRIGLAALPATLKVTAPGFRPRELKTGRPRPGKELVVVLDRGEQVRGVLLDEQRRPFAQAHVWIESAANGAVDARTRAVDQLLRTGQGGAFVLDLPGPGRYRLRLQAEGARTETLPEIVLAPGETRALGTLVLRRGAGVEGVVVDARTGEPLAGVDLELAPEGPQLLEAVLHQQLTRGVSDAQGHFSLAGLGAGQFALTARRSGFALTLRSETLAGDRIVDLGDLRMERGVTVHGHVLDRGGAARGGVTVRFFAAEPSSLLPIAERTTTPEGTFDGPVLASGRYRVQVWSGRLLLSQAIEVPAGKDEWPLELTAGGVHLTGLVTRAGEPVAGGTLAVQSSLDPSDRRGKVVVSAAEGDAFRMGFPETRLTAEVHADGTFELFDAPAGTLRADFLGVDGAPVTRSVEVADGAEASVTIEVGGLSLAGRLTDRAQGSGVAGSVRITDGRGALAATVEAGADGAFTASDLEAGRYGVAASAEGYAPRVLDGVEVGPATPPLAIALDRGDAGTLTVRLTRPDGSPASWVPLALLDATGRMVRAQPTESTGEERFDGLPAGGYVLVWSDSFAGSGATEPFAVESGGERTLERTLPAGAALTLHCALDLCGGRAVESLSLTTASGAELAPYLSGVSAGLSFSADGELPLGRLSPGSYLLRIAAHGTTWSKTVNVDAGDERVGLP